MKQLDIEILYAINNRTFLKLILEILKNKTFDDEHLNSGFYQITWLDCSNIYVVRSADIFWIDLMNICFRLANIILRIRNILSLITSNVEEQVKNNIKTSTYIFNY